MLQQVLVPDEPSPQRRFAHRGLLRGKEELRGIKIAGGWDIYADRIEDDDGRLIDGNESAAAGNARAARAHDFGAARAGTCQGDAQHAMNVPVVLKPRMTRLR